MKFFGLLLVFALSLVATQGFTVSPRSMVKSTPLFLHPDQAQELALVADKLTKEFATARLEKPSKMGHIRPLQTVASTTAWSFVCFGRFCNSAVRRILPPFWTIKRE